MKRLALIAALVAAPALADDPAFGLWMVESGKAAVEVAPCGDSACGRIVWMEEPLDAAGAPKTDVNNKDASKRGNAICGMPMIWGFEKTAPGEWENGNIYNPEDGDTYSSEMAVEGDALKVRGYVGLPLFGKSQVWTRTDRAGNC